MMADQTSPNLASLEYYQQAHPDSAEPQEFVPTCSDRLCTSLLLSRFLRQHLTDVTLVFDINDAMSEMVGGETWVLLHA